MMRRLEIGLNLDAKGIQHPNQKPMKKSIENQSKINQTSAKFNQFVNRNQLEINPKSITNQVHGQSAGGLVGWFLENGWGVSFRVLWRPSK